MSGVDQKRENVFVSQKSKSGAGMTVGGTALSVLCVLLLARAIFRNFLGWEQSLLVGDALVQYVHVIKMFLRHLVQGESLIYSFEAGMGMPTWALYAYYTLSPFNFIYLVIEDIDLATFLLVAGKLMLAGALFCMMLQRLVRSNGMISVILSLFYALGGFSTYFFYGLLFMDMLYLMPIVMLAMERLVRTGRWKSLCVVYAICFAMQFYCGYIIGFFSAVVFFSMTWYRFGGNRSVWFDRLKKYIVCVLAAVLLSAPVTLPTAAELFTHLDQNAAQKPELSLQLWDFLAAFYPGYAGSAYNRVPVVYSGLLMFILLGCFFGGKKVDKKKICMLLLPLVFLIACTFLPGMYMVAHAFDVPDGYCYRFSWQYSFWLLYMAAIGSKQLTEVRNRRVMLILAVFAGIAYFCFEALNCLSLQQEGISYSVRTGVFSAALLMLYAVSLRNLDNGKIWKLLLALLCCVELLYNIGSIKLVFTKDATNDGEYNRIWQQQAEGAIAYIEEQEQVDPWVFYRVRNLNCLTDNISMFYGFHGLGYFLSVEPEKVRATLRDLGYAASGRQVMDYGSAAFTRMIFAQRYSLECGFWQGNQRGMYCVKKNENILPLGFMVSEKLTECELDSSNAFFNQNHLAEAMLGEKLYYPWKIYEGGVEFETDGVEVEPTEIGIKLRLVDEEKEGFAVCSFTNVEDAGRVYAYVPLWGMSGNVKDSINVYSQLDIGGMIWYSKLAGPHIIPLENGADASPELYFKMTPGVKEESFEMVCAAYEDETAIQEIYKKLAGGGWKLTEFSEDALKGTVQATSDRTLLFTSIPYEKNWEAFVDGNRAETIPVLGEAFLAVRVPEGIHEVKVQYNNRMIQPGILIALFGILVLLWPGCMKKQESDTNCVDGN